MHNKSLGNTTEIAVQAETTSDSDTDACWDCFVIVGACTQFNNMAATSETHIFRYKSTDLRA